MSDTNLVRFRAAVAGALAHLESRRQEVNDLNVFPVADGDTGDNMALTLRAVLDELDRLLDGGGDDNNNNDDRGASDDKREDRGGGVRDQSANRSEGGSQVPEQGGGQAPGQGAQRTIDEIGREEIVQSVARAALLGARGNSGVILSQLIRGAAEELVSRPGQLIDATLIGAALAKAADRAYASVREPAEGTILTVAREMAHQIMTDVAHSPENPRLGPATDPTVQDTAIADALERAIATGQESVKRGPQMLAALREAGVVDAGGYGLTIMFAGVVAALRGEDAPDLDHHAPARITHPQHSSSTYRYCTNFAVTGAGLNAADYIAPLEKLGDSVLVVGDESTLKVHLHTDEPERATAVFAADGEVSRLDIADMRLQVAERDERLHSEGEGEGEGAGVGKGVGAGVGAGADAAVPPGLHGRPDFPVEPRPARSRCGGLAVVSGAGVARMFEELGVYTIDGGPTLNPSTYELLAAIHEVPAEEVLVLPSSPNVVMAAERAAELSDKQVLVAPAVPQQAGLVAAVALESERSVQENARALDEALAHVRTGAVAQAARDDAQGRFKRGEAVGFVADEIQAWGDPARTLASVLETLAQEAELISCLAGEDAPLDEQQVRAMVNGTVELELRAGGQRAYWWLLAAE